MRTIMNVALPCLVAGFLFFVTGSPVAADDTKDSPQYIYTCDCGKKCDCNTVATSPGKCPCGKELRENNIIKLDGDQAVVCDCGGGCVCGLSDTDPQLCSCGVPLNEVSLKGLYACACGAGCACNTISDQPGNCACGKELRKVE